MSTVTAGTAPAPVSALRILMASFVGTAIEFYDFYVYGTAAALAFGPIFFPGESHAAQLLSAFATFSIAFIARPIGALLFGHFGDRVGRKSTLIASLLTMGISTTLIGVLPGYTEIGYAAPLILCLLRFGQGIGFGGEWGGAALLSIENAPAGKRAWYGMFPQLGAPIGFIAANGTFLFLALSLSNDSFHAWGWRIPFLLSAVLVGVGLYVRVTLTETPVFQALAQQSRVRVPLKDLFRDYPARTLLATLSMVACYAVFYLSTVFVLGYGTATLHYPRESLLQLECFAIVFMAIGIVLSAYWSDRFGRRPVLLLATAATAVSGLLFAPMLGGGSFLSVTLFLSVELFLMGLMFGPMGAFLPELFPTRLRYTGAAVSYNLGGILGASFAPFIAQMLVERGGLGWVGFYLVGASILSFVALLLLKETRHHDLTGPV